MDINRQKKRKQIHRQILTDCQWQTQRMVADWGQLDESGWIKMGVCCNVCDTW